MGHNVGELRQIRSDALGTEASSARALDTPWVTSLIEELRLKPALSSRDQGRLATYVWDMGQALAESSRVLKNGGRAVYVVGESTIRCPPPQHRLSTAFMDTRLRREVVIVFKKR